MGSLPPVWESLRRLWDQGNFKRLCVEIFKDCLKNWRCTRHESIPQRLSFSWVIKCLFSSCLYVNNNPQPSLLVSPFSSDILQFLAFDSFKYDFAFRGVFNIFIFFSWNYYNFTSRLSASNTYFIFNFILVVIYSFLE
mgnify:CR=1 FL=1